MFSVLSLFKESMSILFVEFFRFAFVVVVVAAVIVVVIVSDVVVAVVGSY